MTDLIGKPVRVPVRESAWSSYNLVEDSAEYSVRSFVRISVLEPVWDYVWAFVRDQVKNYMLEDLTSGLVPPHARGNIGGFFGCDELDSDLP